MTLEGATKMNYLRILMVGKRGVGKSSTGNTILGKEYFKPGRGWSSETQYCDWIVVNRDGQSIELTDTPGVCDTHRKKEEVQLEIAKTVATMTPGPHVILMIFSGGGRFTPEEEWAYKELKELFGHELTRHMIVVFTGMERVLKYKMDFSKELEKAPPSLKTVLQEANGRYVCFDNNADWADRRKQADTLLKRVHELIAANQGRCYSTELLKQFEQKMQGIVTGTTTMNSLRFLMIGKTGVGKSSAGNTVLGKEYFKPGAGWSSETQYCDWNFVNRDGQRIELTDTPGVCDTHRKKEEVQLEIAKTVATMTPGPHVILMIFKGGDRFTNEEELAYNELKELFGHELTRHMIVVFTRMDEFLKNNSLEKSNNTDFSKELEKAPPALKTVLQEANGRYVCFNNNADWADRRKQADTLLKRVHELIAANKGKCYSTELLKRFEKKMQEIISVSGKTRDEIKNDVIHNQNSEYTSGFSRFLQSIHPRNLCRIM